MTTEEKVSKTLPELGVTETQGVEALFAEVRAAMEGERAELISRGAPASHHERVCKALRDRWLARKNGLLARLDEHWLKAAPRELKPAVGKCFNELRRASAALELKELIRTVPVLPESPGTRPPDAARHESLQESLPFEIPGDVAQDLTLPGYRRPLGTLHPITRVQREIEDIFLGLGFWIENGPEIESVYYNFDALNIPESHPSRDDWDTLYINAQTVLRTHTSPVQIRAMEKYGAPLHIIIPGKCYRHDNPDSTHSPMFHQIEGLAIDTDITFADLKGTLDFFAKKFFGEKVRTRFQPSFFPFTEPSGEVAISCIFCGGEGCRVCKESGWIEVMGCGMVHPVVLRNGGIDPDKYSGWAFGLGVDRFAMLKYDINDIQLFFQSDVRFLEQF
ncbi:MAG TPA: phenylalanine--tRNA ligase subunit alpha [Terriglobia bacterium]|jgi:phenylalanyl-tRNA synthetase alpha chain|nr:phenylalanine--tRNA ligase subunit alpha [Terriglobia bacterium]